MAQGKACRDSGEVLTICCKHDHGKMVTKDEFSDGGEYQKETAQDDIASTATHLVRSRPCTILRKLLHVRSAQVTRRVLSTLPAQQNHGKGRKDQEEASKSAAFMSVVVMLGLETTAYIGVGFPNVWRRSPLTLFGGLRYSFSNISGDMLMVSAVLMRSNVSGWDILASSIDAGGY